MILVIINRKATAIVRMSSEPQRHYLKAVAEWLRCRVQGIVPPAAIKPKRLPDVTRLDAKQPAYSCRRARRGTVGCRRTRRPANWPARRPCPLDDARAVNVVRGPDLAEDLEGVILGQSLVDAFDGQNREVGRQLNETRDGGTGQPPKAKAGLPGHR